MFCRRCADLLSQAQHHVTRARRIEDEERVLQEKQLKEREFSKMKQMEEEVCIYMYMYSIITSKIMCMNYKMIQSYDFNIELIVHFRYPTRIMKALIVLNPRCHD